MVILHQRGPFGNESSGVNVEENWNRDEIKLS